MVKVIHNKILPLLILAGLLFSASNAFADSDSVDFSVTVDPSLLVSVSTASVNFEITPTIAGAYNSANFTVTSATNNAYGYTLLMTTNKVNLESNVVNPSTSVNYTIPTLTETQAGISATDFQASTDPSVLNHYGVAIGANNYNAIKPSNQVKKTSANNTSGTDTTTISFASKLDLATVPGTYSTTLNFQMVANPLPGGLEEAYQNANKTKKTINGKQYYAMQDMSTSICNAATLSGDVIEVYDNRDDTVYHIGKLADGKCWLLDNLAIDLVNTSIDMLKSRTNASDTTIEYLKGVRAGTSSDKYAIEEVANWSSNDSFTVPLINISNKNTISSDVIDQAEGWKIGGYYNYCAATAGSFCWPDSLSIPGTPAEDICPVNWGIPTQDEFLTAAGGDTQITTDPGYTAFRNTFHFTFSGYYENSAVVGLGTTGALYSSTFRNTIGGVSGMDAVSYYVRPIVFGISRNKGLPVRCIAD